MADLKEGINRRDILRGGAISAAFAALKAPTAITAASSLLSACGRNPVNDTERLALDLQKLGLLVDQPVHIGPKTIIIFAETHDSTVSDAIVKSKKVVDLEVVALEGLREDIEKSPHFMRVERILRRAFLLRIGSEEAREFGLKTTPVETTRAKQLKRSKFLKEQKIPIIGTETSDRLVDAACYVEPIAEVYDYIRNRLNNKKDAFISFHRASDPSWVRYQDQNIAAFQELQKALKGLFPDFPVLSFKGLASYTFTKTGRSMRVFNQSSNLRFDTAYSKFAEWRDRHFLETRSKLIAKSVTSQMREAGQNTGAIAIGASHTIRHSGYRTLQDYIKHYGEGEFSYIVVHPYKFTHQEKPFEIIPIK